MIIKHATADDFQRWEAYAKGLSVAQLRHAMKDCREAGEAIIENQPYYSDQSATLFQELKKR